MTQSGLTALIGPLSSSPAHHVQCMTAQMHVPHIETRYDYSNVLSPYSINIHPHPPVLGKVSDLTIILVKDVCLFSPRNFGFVKKGVSCFLIGLFLGVNLQKYF